jgi:NAD+ synthase (glutamine-hydrolysing)
MKIALAQLNYHIGNFDQNNDKIIGEIKKAKTLGAELVVFAEMAICGYPPRDFLDFDDFIESCYLSLDKIAAECVGIAAVVGCPSRNPDNKGKRLHNSAFFLAEGKIKNIVNKTLLPTYDVFDEYRYFEPNRSFDVVEYNGSKIAVTICEDLWTLENQPLYTACPMDELTKQNPDFVVNIAASPFNYHQSEIRNAVITGNAVKYKVPVVYVNHIGAQTELLFDGGSMAVNSEGKVLYELDFFKEDFKIFDTNNTDVNVSLKKPVLEIELIHDALVMGLKDYFRKLGFNKAILGLSGGIDSAVTLVLAARALGSENVKAVLLPSRFSSSHSIDDAKKLAENINCDNDIISIEDSFLSIEKTLSSVFENMPSDLTEENMQARIRAVILMAMSNKFGYILLNTSNKSEAAVGYGTLYGDMCGGISVLGDVYKTQVYELADFINKDKEVIPVNSITKPPSAELRFDQKDSDSLPEYDILDKILFQYIELAKGPDEIIALGFDKAVVLKTLRLVNINEYKRYQTPPILRVSPKAFGMGRRMPIAAKYLL